MLTMQPNEGVSLSLAAKIPGTRMRIRPVNMEFLYGTSFLSQSPEAYERLILDAMRGDATLFTRNDEVEEQWRICDPIVTAWARRRGRCRSTRPGRRGRRRRSDPAARRRTLAADLSAASGRVTRHPGFRQSSGPRRDTTPAEIEAALRKLLVEGQTQNVRLRACAGAEHGLRRRQGSGAGRSPTACAASGRYLASRTIMCIVEPKRERIDARAEISSDAAGPERASRCCARW